MPVIIRKMQHAVFQASNALYDKSSIPSILYDKSSIPSIAFANSADIERRAMRQGLRRYDMHGQ